MLTAERIITAHILGALSISPLAASFPSRQFRHEPSDAIQYGTHGTHLASQFHEQYDAVRMIRAWQNPQERRGTHLASFITYDEILKNGEVRT